MGVTAESRRLLTAVPAGGQRPGRRRPGLRTRRVLLFHHVLGPLAIISGGVGLSRAKRGAGHRGMSLAAIMLGIVDLTVHAVLVIAVTSNWSAAPGTRTRSPHLIART